MDDFDGQCCRTFPYNHSRIQRWAEERKKKKKKESDDIRELPPSPASPASSRHLENVQNIKIPTSCFDKSVSGGPVPGDSITTTAGIITAITAALTSPAELTESVAGTIPVGIVSARQRTETEKGGSSQASSVCATPTSSACSSGLRTSVPDLSPMPLPPSGPLVSSSHGIGPSTWSSGPPPPWPPSPAAPPPPRPPMAPPGVCRQCPRPGWVPYPWATSWPRTR